nr:hypothetical protein [Tanacetum cinerariifolium]
MSYLLTSITARITKQVKIQLPQILPKEVSNLAHHDPKHATPHKECYDGLIKSYELDKSLFFIYDKVYSLKRSQEGKDKDEDPSAGSDRGLKKRKISKDAEPTKGLKTKESKFGSSKGTKSQLKSSGKSIQAEELEFEVADSDIPHNEEGNLGNNDGEPIREATTKRD